MAFSFTFLSSSLPTLLSHRFNVISPKTHHSHGHRWPLAITSTRKYYANSFDIDGIKRFQQIYCQVTLYEKLQQQGLEGETENYDGETEVKILEPKFKMSLAELLEKSKVVPLSVYGDLEVEVTSTQQDSREVKSGDLFICCAESSFDARLHLTEAHRRGVVAAIASKSSGIDDNLGYKALVIVEDTNSVMAALAASFYGHPSKSMCVIAITGTNGKTTSTYLIKGLFEALGKRIGLLGTIDYYIHGDNKVGLDSPLTTPDANAVQMLMAKMVHNGSEAVVMEASSEGLSVDRCREVDFNIAVFTNFTRDHLDFHGTMDEYKKSKAKLFQRMVDPERHRKVVNIDDPNSDFFIAQGNPQVHLVTFAIDKKNADVHALNYELSLSGTRILVNTPHRVLEISSSLLGRHNVYNILGTVAVGIAVGAALDDMFEGSKMSKLFPEGSLHPKRIITVFGCGGDRDQEKRPIMTKISTDKSEVTILTSDNPRNEDPLDILDDMLAGVGHTLQDYLKYEENDYHAPLPDGHQLFVHQNRRVAIRNAIAMGEEGDMIVIAGKGHEIYLIQDDKKEFFDDREECRVALKLRYANQD
ncbi:Acid-amino acid ligase, isoform 2 [Hibiscus syriacus]|uniref:Acid-amino acid ligase, isoform 2 n=1 Tax=Hibiscus syriacus TaxID=106335 RepID=A0A6A3CT50_HIBSY|nr:Acid-amino acid ligase, isoform 2 [Hibiscus syriacus]